MDKILLLNPCCYGENWHLTGISGCRWSAIAPNTIDKMKLIQQKDCYYAMFPFPLAFTSAILKKQGNETKVLDCIALNLTYQEMYERIKQFNPNKVIMETSSVSFEQDLEIGINLQEFLNIDITFVGASIPIVKDELIKYNLKFIEGNYIKHYSGGQDNYAETLPAPDRDEETALMYNDFHSFSRYIKRPQMQVWTTIGCPYKCTFCQWRWSMYKGQVAFRSIEAIKEEIEINVKKYGYKSVLFDGDTENIGDKRFIELSKMMGKLGIQWSFMGRIDSCSLKAFQIAKDNGCISAKIGVETFSKRMLDKIEKGLDGEDLFKRIIALVDMGFFVYLSTMKFILGQTADEISRDTFLLNELYKIGVRFQQPHCLPLPYTPMGKQFQEFEIKKYGDNEDFFEYGRYYSNNNMLRKIEAFSKEKNDK